MDIIIKTSLFVLSIGSALFLNSSLASDISSLVVSYDHFATTIKQADTTKPIRLIKSSAKKPHSLKVPSKSTFSKEIKPLAASNECTVNTLYSLSADALIDYIVACKLEEIDQAPFFESNTKTQQLFSENNLMAMAEAIKINSASYNSDKRQGLAELMFFARAGFYMAFYSDSFNYTPDVFAAFKTATQAFAQNSHFLDTDDEHRIVLQQWINLVDGSESWINNYAKLFAILDDYPTQSVVNTTYAGIAPLYDVQFVIWRGQNNNTEFYELINNDQQMVARYIRLVADLHVYLGTDNEVVFINVLGELGRLLGYSNHAEQAQTAITKLLETYTRLSPEWLKLAFAINDFGDCTQFDVECIDDLKRELMDIAFPNTFVFDDGNLVIRTAINMNKAQALYHAQKQVEAQFKRKNEELLPLASDENEILTMFVYGTRSEYQQFQPYLFDLDADNGGIYIESWGQFFTYERTSTESIYTLEELFRHEYVHYLHGRYTIEGLWGETTMYQDNRLTWFEEGGAEFFAGATQADGVQLRKIMIENIKWDNGAHLSISEIVKASYATGFKFYRYGALFFNFLNETQPQTITELHKIIRADDVAAFDAAVANFANDALLQANYAEYLNAKIAGIDEMKDFSPTAFPFPNYLDTDLLQDIQNQITTVTVFAAAVCDRVVTTGNVRFGCSGSVTGTSVAELNIQLNTGLSTLNDVLNNFTTMNCALGNVTPNGELVSAPYYCEGGLRELGTVQMLNQAPIANAGEDITVDTRVQTKLSAAASSDVEGDTLTYTWLQTTGEPVENIDPLGGFDKMTLSFYAYDEHEGKELTFQLTVSDGQYTSTDEVVVTVRVMPKNQAPIANAGDDVSIGLRQATTLSAAKSTDVDSDVLSYAWVQLSGEPVENIDPSGGFDKESFAFYAYEQHDGTKLIFQLTVSDGEYSSTDEVVVTVGVIPDNRAPVANAGDDMSIGLRQVTMLTAAKSSDLDGDSLSYSWVQTTGEPVENIDPLGGFDKESFAFYAYEQHDGTKLTFQLTVSDGQYSSTDEVVVTVATQTANHAPLAEAGGNQSVKEGTIVTLNGSGSDPDGDTLTMTWEQTAGTSVTLIDGIFTAPQVTSSEVLIFTLTVSDNELSSTDTVHITVNNIADTDTKPIVDKDRSGGSVGWFTLMFCVLFIWRQKNLKRP